jgi:hypothetical protein
LKAAAGGGRRRDRGVEKMGKRKGCFVFRLWICRVSRIWPGWFAAAEESGPVSRNSVEFVSIQIRWSHSPKIIEKSLKFGSKIGIRPGLDSGHDRRGVEARCTQVLVELCCSPRFGLWGGSSCEGMI